MKDSVGEPKKAPRINKPEFSFDTPSLFCFLESAPPAIQLSRPKGISVREELALYLEEPRENGNPLDYWRDKEKTLPILSKYAKKVLTAPGSTADIESKFNYSTMILTDRRLQTSDYNFETLLFCKINSGYGKTFNGDF